MDTKVKASVNDKSLAASQKAKNMSSKRIETVTLIYVPLHLGGRHRGSSIGPAAMRVAELSESIRDFGVTIADEVEIDVPHSICWWDRNTAAKCVPEINDVSLAVSQAVEEALAKGSVPITIGGDHSLSIGSIAGASNHFRKQGEKLGLVWFDAHGDINTPDTSSSGNVHGMPLAISLGYGDKRLVDLHGYSPKIEADKAYLIGIRDLDPPERDMIIASGIQPYTMHDIDRVGFGKVMTDTIDRLQKQSPGIHLSFDIDALDPDLAPGVSTPARGGISYREITMAFSMLAEAGLVRSIDVVELNPAFDIQNRTAELAVELVLTMLGKKIL